MSLLNSEKNLQRNYHLPSNLLLHYLAQSKSYNFTFLLGQYVMSGRISFTSSYLLIYFFLYDTNVIIIGLPL